MRRCIEITVQGLRLRGTVHLPPPGMPGLNSGLEGLGVIILQQGFSPRSWEGDLAVALSDSLATAGLTTVRMDLPGLGDSEGDLPEDFLSLIDNIQEGGFAKVANECMDRLRAQLGFQRFILGGHCGGAITDFFAVSSRTADLPIGIFSLDTAFHLVRGAQPPAGKPQVAPPRATWAQRKEVLRNEFRTALLNSPVGAPLQKTVQCVRDFVRHNRPHHVHPVAEDRGRPDTQQPLPPEANLRLLKCVDQVLQTGVPLLFVKAEDPGKQLGFDYLAYVLSRRQGKVTDKRIAGTDHGFLAGDGKPRLLECVTEWIQKEFRSLDSHPHALSDADTRSVPLAKTFSTVA